MISKENISEILTLLAERLALSLPGKKWDFLVCGGTALNALNLVIRTTKDVDIIGRVENNAIIKADLEKEFLEEIKVVSQYCHIPSDWFNTGPESYLKSGLPEGILHRLKWFSYGPNLSCGFISRIDQIFFKLCASADRGGYHVSDLKALNPSENEIFSASKWTLEQDASSEYKMILISMLKQIGYSNVAQILSK
jgi:hypothetical protein